ncbi:DKNYY domain-containing protein [Spirulina sp. CCNP1310]|uniref:DKNYY domain-containing protein n=1 Tax=Spirulina sp. CCNP1310 TaxID=3110249 RepID=UPI002B1FB879|nr:DKNYY domain-containing protein [Spirulina sp. CCNP1310]MEA5418882.1 DKNYY domain-containing protein [Spirulina sp. CCNP1310]
MKLPRIAQMVLVLALLGLAACRSEKLGYAVRGREVYYRHLETGKVIPGIWAFQETVETLVPGADGKTFQRIEGSPDYAKDAQQVFYQSQPIAGAEVATFQWVHGYYAKDARQVYFMGTVVVGADPAFFKMLWLDSVAEDKRDWYVQGNPVGIRDRPSLKQVVDLNQVTYADANIWAYDKYNYYVGNYHGIEAVAIADPATFQVMENDSDYAKDATQVYYLDRIVPQADPRTFEALGHRYSKDAHHAYYNGYLFEPADVASLQAVGRDKFDLYNQADTYAKDAQRVYCGMGVVEGADVATFVADEQGVRDKNKRYFKCSPMEEAPKTPS